MRAGIHSLSGSYTTHLVTTVPVGHINYDGVTNKNDISIVRVVPPFDFNLAGIAPVCLPEQDFVHETGTIIQIAGFGKLSGADTNPANIMQAVNLTISDAANCNPEINTVMNSDIQLCTSSVGMTTCNGDSGGGATTINPNTGRMELVGLVSFGDATCNSVAVFTRVAHYIDWVKSSTSDATCY